MAGRLIIGKGFERKLSWPNRCTVPLFEKTTGNIIGDYALPLKIQT
jgi:hypothetical protein